MASKKQQINSVSFVEEIAVDLSYHQAGCSRFTVLTLLK
jgi:hypothetical protein